MPLAPLRRGFSSRFGAFEEPPRMSSERDICLRKADEAKQRAAQATEPSTKSAYEKVAEYWIRPPRVFPCRRKNSEDAYQKTDGPTPQQCCRRYPCPTK